MLSVSSLGSACKPLHKSCTQTLQSQDHLSDSYMELDSQLAIFDGSVHEKSLIDDNENDNNNFPSNYDDSNDSGKDIPDTPGKNLATFTLLPKTPDKELRGICRTMVREGVGAMVALPSSSSLSQGVSVRPNYYNSTAGTSRYKAHDIKDNEKFVNSHCLLNHEKSDSVGEQASFSSPPESPHQTRPEDCEVEDTRSYSGYMELMSLNVEGSVNILKYSDCNSQLDPVVYSSQQESVVYSSQQEPDVYSSQQESVVYSSQQEPDVYNSQQESVVYSSQQNPVFNSILDPTVYDSKRYPGYNSQQNPVHNSMLDPPVHNSMQCQHEEDNFDERNIEVAETYNSVTETDYATASVPCLPPREEAPVFPAGEQTQFVVAMIHGTAGLTRPEDSIAE